MPSDHSWEMGSKDPYSWPIVMDLGFRTVIWTLFSSMRPWKKKKEVGGVGGTKEMEGGKGGKERGKGEREGREGREGEKEGREGRERG